MATEEMFSGRISVEGSNLNPQRTRAAVARLAVALERRLKENCPINKNPNKRGGALRASIKVNVGKASMEEGIDIQASSLDYMKYVIGGTTAHEITPRSPGYPLGFMWNIAAASHETYIGNKNVRIRRASSGPVAGYRGLTGDL